MSAHNLSLFVVRTIAVVCAAVFVASVHGAAAGAQQQPGPALFPRIVNGVMTHAEPATGAMLRGDRAALNQHLPINRDTARNWCSGTLIGCRTFLTAGHCVDDLFADETWVYLQHAGLFTVTSVARHPAYAFPVADLAVLKLGEPVNGIAPIALKVTWKWINGATTTLNDIADPMGATNYTLCLHAGINSSKITLPAGSKWEAAGPKGYKFKDASATPGGAEKAVLKSGDAGKAKVLVKGQGAQVAGDLVVVPLPVTVQLVNDTNAVCFEAVYDAGDVIRNDGGQFKAKTK